MSAIETINKSLMLIFFICYFYQFVYIIISFLPTKNTKANDTPHKFAILIAARNEEKVIGNLLNSINMQDYPKEYFDIYVEPTIAPTIRLKQLKVMVQQSLSVLTNFKLEKAMY